MAWWRGGVVACTTLDLLQYEKSHTLGHWVSAEQYNTMGLYGNMLMQTARSSIAVSHFTDILFYSSDGQTVKRFLKFNF